jgi:anti-sigma regulatory factor (Ser/Thr protein kinase)
MDVRSNLVSPWGEPRRRMAQPLTWLRQRCLWVVLGGDDREFGANSGDIEHALGGGRSIDHSRAARRALVHAEQRVGSAGIDEAQVCEIKDDDRRLAVHRARVEGASEDGHGGDVQLCQPARGEACPRCARSESLTTPPTAEHMIHPPPREVVSAHPPAQRRRESRFDPYPPGGLRPCRASRVLPVLGPADEHAGGHRCVAEHERRRLDRLDAGNWRMSKPERDGVVVRRYARFRLPAEPGSVRSARQWVQEFDGLPEQALADAQLVVSELVTNSIVHAGLGPDDPIMVLLRRDDDRLAIEVDDGDGFFGRPGQHIPARRPGGRGLTVLDALCEQWQADAGRVLASIRL